MFFIQCIIVPVVFSVLIAMFLFGMYGFFNKYKLNSIVLDLIKNPISIAVIIIITQFIYMINFNFPNPLCTYEIEAKVIKNDSIYFEGSDTPPYDLENNYNSLITIEYLYRNRKYKNKN